MTVLKLSPVEFRPHQNDVSVLFQIDWKRPSGREARLYIAIDGRYDIDDALAYLKRKLGPRVIEFQPSLLHTWSWEDELVRALVKFNLTGNGS